MTGREKLTGPNGVPTEIDWQADAETVQLIDPPHTIALRHHEARSLLRRLAERYPEEVEMLVAEWAESRSAAMTELADRARIQERWCSWCAGPVSIKEDYARHMARHI